MFLSLASGTRTGCTITEPGRRRLGFFSKGIEVRWARLKTYFWRSTCTAQALKRSTLGFGSGQDLAVRELEPPSRALC